MSTWLLEWNSSAAERYDDVMWPAAQGFIETASVEVLDMFGGSSLSVPDTDPNGADNGFMVKCDELTARRLAGELTTIVKHEVTVTAGNE